MSAKDIRNIVLLGHGGSGKTTLAESMLFMTGGTDRFGKVTDGNTTCDYDAEEIKRNISISLAVAPVKYKNVKINVLDTPGNFDFAGEVLSGIRAAECAVLVCGAKDGLSVGAERAWKMLGNKPRMIFINRTDEENSDYNACFDALKGKFGTAVAPIVAPIIDGSKKVTGIVDLLHNKAYEVKGGKAAECAIPADIADEVEALRAELMEAAAGADEELMEKFFETMELSAEEIAKGLKLGVRDGSVAPVLCGSAISGLGVDMLMQTVLDLVPVATDMPAEAAQDDDGNAVEVAHDENGATAAIVFKTVSDQYGKFSLVKVVRGKITGDMSLYDTTTGNTEKLGRLYTLKGKKNEEVKEICCGDIGAIAKMAPRQDRRHPLRPEEHRQAGGYALRRTLLLPRHRAQDPRSGGKARHRPQPSERGRPDLYRRQQRRDPSDGRLRRGRHSDRRAREQAQDPLRRGRRARHPARALP